MLRFTLDGTLPLVGTWYALYDKIDGPPESLPMIGWGVSRPAGSGGAPSSQVIGLVVDPDQPTQVVFADELTDRRKFTGYSQSKASTSGSTSGHLL